MPRDQGSVGMAMLAQMDARNKEMDEKMDARMEK